MARKRYAFIIADYRLALENEKGPANAIVRMDQAPSRSRHATNGSYSRKACCPRLRHRDKKN